MATSVIALVAILTVMTIGAFSAVGSTLGSVLTVVGQGVETVASSSGKFIAQGFNEVVGQVEQIDTNELDTQTTQLLKDTDIPELQPNYLNAQLQEASTEIANAGREIVLNPEEADQILEETINSLQEKAETIANAADREAIANAVSKNTELTQAEAEEAADATAKASTWGFVALVLGMVVTSITGFWGSNFVVDVDEAHI